jgi:peptidoglycan/xylan/chitin deacetylase (PgdA/CDA1 family)
MSSDHDGEQASLITSALLKLFLVLIILSSCKNLVKEKYVYTKENNSITAKTTDKEQPTIKKKKIYLTFDDGPNKGTEKILNIIQQEKVKASFFLVGEHAFASNGQQQIWANLQMAKNIELCNHSYSHAMHNKFNAFYKDPDRVVNDFKKSKDTLKLNNNICRMPGRNAWRIDMVSYTDLKKTKAAIDSLQQAGFSIIGWDLEWHYDPKYLRLKNTADDLLKQIDSVFKNNKTKIPDELVLLAHDQVYKDAADSAELHSLIKKLKEKDEYELQMVSEYPGIRK